MYYVLTKEGNARWPCFLVDAEGDAAGFATVDEAELVALQHPLCQAHGHVVFDADSWEIV